MVGQHVFAIPVFLNQQLAVRIFDARRPVRLEEYHPDEVAAEQYVL